MERGNLYMTPAEAAREVPPQIMHAFNFRFIQKPQIWILSPGHPKVMKIIEVRSLQTDDARGDEWARVDTLEYPRFIGYSLRKEYCVPYRHHPDCILELFWSPRKFYGGHPVPLEKQPDEIQVTGENFIELLGKGIRLYCDGDWPQPPCPHPEEPVVCFILRGRPRKEGEPEFREPEPPVEQEIDPDYDIFSRERIDRPDRFTDEYTLPYETYEPSRLTQQWRPW
ncbi:uncharacterized protein N7483_004751 [Penicillium malachiteum]|uniref:uncharacterized protein n=1 Tax=Penicillium malachiteum TaxID=1324776 RepID=UPI0025471C48|nr:uncharacterized protein N7483_004751 [Penicillium malachiteum]KAJ5730243.1 hypothetical protein N7483_004751 [Penicillium malachiteum]